MQTAPKVAAGWEKEKISNLVDGALTDVIDPLVYTEAVELIESHQEADAGCTVSASRRRS